MTSSTRIISKAARRLSLAVGGTAIFSGVALLRQDENAFPFNQLNRRKLMQLDTREYEMKISAEDLEHSVASLCRDVDRCLKPLKLTGFGSFMAQMGIHDEQTITSLYTMFTEAKSGCPATHLELAYWCTKLSEGSMTRKLNFAFDTCDVDRDGEITRDEMAHFLAVLFTAHGTVKAAVPKNSETMKVYKAFGESLVDDIFTEADKDHNGAISSQEFHEWAEGQKTSTAVLITKILDEWLHHSVALLY